MYNIIVDGYEVGITKMNEQTVAELRELGFIVTPIENIQ